MSERLDRIEALVEANAVGIAELRPSIAELRSSVNSLVQVAELHQRDLEVSQHNFEAIMTEIRGMRLESQRILEHLFGNQGNGA
jgi:hypothetical protein